MRDIDRIFGHSLGRRRILFEEGLWCIYEKGSEGCYVIHRCIYVKFALDNELTPDQTDWRCGITIHQEGSHGCGEEAPDSVKTLFLIHRWKR